MHRYLIVVLLLLVVACADKNNAAPTDNAVKNKNNVANLKAAQADSKPWVGEYFGVLPCDSCDGISTFLILTKEGQYILEQHFENAAMSEKTQKGKIIWHEHILEIAGNFYQLEQDNMQQLNKNKKAHIGNNAQKYILARTQLQQQIDANHGFELVQYQSQNGKKLAVIFDTNTTPATASFNLDGKMWVLPQVQAWAHGAQYEQDKISIIFNDDDAKLTVNGKTTKYSVQ